MTTPPFEDPVQCTTEFGTITVEQPVRKVWDQYGWPADHVLRDIAQKQARDTAAHQAEVILRAALLMRSRAEAATRGPWLSMDGGDRLVHDPGHDLDPPEYVVNEPMSNAANAEHIASWHPLVALQVAEFLESYGQELKESRSVGEPGATATAYAIACAYLGETVAPTTSEDE